MSFAKFSFDIIDVACNKSQNAISYGPIESEKDIPYDNNTDNEYLKLDIYAKKFDSSIKHPVIINFHGGGFVSGDKKYRRGIADYFLNQLSEENFLYINANYRLANGKDIVFPTPVQDCAKAMQWVVDNQEKYNFDMDNIFVSGDSAGAYLAMCMLNLTLNNDYAESIGAVKPNLKVKGGFLGCGPYDVLTALDTVIYGLKVGTIVGKPFTGLKKVNKETIQSYEKLREINPINYVSEEYPVLFFAHTDYDELCPGHATIVINKLKELGVESHEYHLDKKQGVNHCFFLTQKNKYGEECYAQAIAYFKEMVRK